MPHEIPYSIKNLHFTHDAFHFHVVMERQNKTCGLINVFYFQTALNINDFRMQMSFFFRILFSSDTICPLRVGG